MTDHVALLRGVNVGRIKVTSQALRAMADDLGLGDPRTVLATGNLLFHAEEPPETLKARIEQGLSDTFGYDAWIVLTTAAHLARVVDAYPFTTDEDGYQPYVLFGSDQAVLDEILAAAGDLDLDAHDERIAPGEGVVYWECPRGTTTSTAFAKLIGRVRYRPTTTNRNLRTLRKML